jgi:hypothetical protein
MRGSGQQRASYGRTLGNIAGTACSKLCSRYIREPRTAGACNVARQPATAAKRPRSEAKRAKRLGAREVGKASEAERVGR